MRLLGNSAMPVADRKPERQVDERRSEHSRSYLGREDCSRVAGLGADNLIEVKVALLDLSATMGMGGHYASGMVVPLTVTP